VTLPDVEVLIPSRPDYVALVRHVVGATARLGGLAPDVVDDAKLAASEATTNAVTMTSRAGVSDPVEVRAVLEGDRIVVEVADRGAYEAQGVGSEDTTDSLEFSFERGLSLPLIQGLVDGVEISPREGGGTSIRMTIVEERGERAET
jgi:serine/threonine-protein kinase RsbW